MLIKDKSLILKRLWEQPACNAELIIALSPDAVVFADTADGSGGFVAVQQYPHGKFAWVDAPSADQAEALLVEAGIHECRRVMTFDNTIAGMIEQKLGFQPKSQGLCYSLGKDDFQPCETPECVKPVTRESASYVLDFASTEADDHPSWESQISEGDWSSTAYYVEDNGSIAGYADSIAQPGKLREVGYVFVKPEMRGKGYGKMLVSAVTAHMLNSGQIPLYIVDASNQASIGTCESVGYRVYGRSWVLGKEGTAVADTSARITRMRLGIHKVWTQHA